MTFVCENTLLRLPPEGDTLFIDVTVWAPLTVSRVSFGLVDPCGLGVIILASGSEVRGFKSRQGLWIFSERKTPEYDFLRKGSKAVGPVS